ncbi:hypothetical protein BBJ28_00007013 [Nothophytophthora sp. Chile5]|nr:hypothetical protein BBJ28_00007013 [Nothophytophthora sp. Chile5]
MNRELDGLLSKLTQINNEMGGDDGKNKKGKNKGDHFHELKTQIGERLHRLKLVSAPSTSSSAIVLSSFSLEGEVVLMRKHPREAIRRQQEIREDIRLVGVDIKELTTSYEQEAKKKKTKFPPEELATRKEIVMQYSVEFERIKELAAANYRSPAGRTGFETVGVAAPIGSFENGAFTARTRPGGGVGGGPGFGAGGFGAGGLGGGGGGGGGDGTVEREVITDDQHAMMADIQRNDQRFVSLKPSRNDWSVASRSA